jgi:hypothetical protein
MKPRRAVVWESQKANVQGQSSQGLDLLMRRAGLTLSSDELARLQPLYDAYLEHVKALYSSDLGEEEPADFFSCEWTPDR